MSMQRAFLSVAFLAELASAQVPLFWDTDAAAGIQGGNGAWTESDVNWTTNRVKAVTPAGWSPGSYANFVIPSNGVASTVTLSTPLSVGFVNVAANDLTLIVTNGGQLLNTVSNCFLGNTKTGSVTIVTGAGSLWDLGTKDLSIGYGIGGVSNLLLIQNGGAVSNGGIIVGNNNIASVGNQIVIDNASLFVRGNSAISVGERGNGNAIILTNGALLRRLYDATGNATVLGNNTGVSFNRIVVTTNCTWDNGNSYLYIGSSASAADNSVLIDGGAMTNLGSNQRIGIGYAAFTTRNSLVVTNGGLFQWGNDRNFSIGYGNTSSFNRVEFSAGAIGIGSANNSYIGYGIGAFSNSLLIGWNALVTNCLSFYIGNGKGAFGNTLIINGGTLYVDKLYASYPGNSLEFKGGTLCLLAASIHTNGLPLSVGDGIQSATLMAGSSLEVPLGVVVTNNATLTGLGPIASTSGASLIYGTVNPGRNAASGSTLLHNGALTLKPGSEVQIDLVSTNRTSGWDRLVVTNGTLSLGGTLKPVLQGGFLPAATNVFPYILSNSVALAGALDGQANNTRINAYSNDLLTVVGSFRLGISNQFAVLSDFQAAAAMRSAGTLMLIR